jgi:hypothetical protein
MGATAFMIMTAKIKPSGQVAKFLIITVKVPTPIPYKTLAIGW